MKKIILIFSILLLLTVKGNAQFHFELGVNPNVTDDEFANTYDLGAGIYLEPKIAISKAFDVGLFLGVNAFVGFGKNNNSNDDFDSTWLLSVLPSVTYRFLNGKITPYVGLSVGKYFAEPIFIAEAAFDGGQQSHFGYALRLGVYLGRLNLGAMYNKAGDISFWQFNLGIRILNRK